jgi:hypothetical protein
MFIDFDGSISYDDEYGNFDEYDQTCSATYATGGSDPHATTCDQPRGHYKYGSNTGTQHEGPDAFGGGGRVKWSGGGTCAGDPIPYRDVEFIGDQTRVHPPTRLAHLEGGELPPSEPDVNWDNVAEREWEDRTHRTNI